MKLPTLLAFCCPILVASVTQVNVALMQRLTDLREQAGEQVLSDVWRSVAIGSLLGVKDFNERNDRYIPELSGYASCDVELSPTINASKPMATLAGIDGIPQVSYWSTSDAFDQQKSTYPYFARTIPADSAVAKAAAQLFASYGHKYVGIAFVQDAYGEAYKDAFVTFATELGIEVSTQGFAGGSEVAVKAAIDNFALERLQVGIAIIFGNDFDRFFEYATEKGLCGPGTLWILSEATGNGEVLARTGDLQVAANGMGRLLSQGGVPGNPKYDAFAADWQHFDSQASLVSYIESNFFSYTADAGSSHPDGTDLSQLASDFFATVSPDDVATYAYDAAMTVGMAACDYVTSGESFAAGSYDVDKFYAKIKALTFSSISGEVSFDEFGSRTASSGNYMMYNFKVNDGTTSVDAVGSWTEAGGWAWTTPFRFSDDTILPPPAIKVPDHEKNFLGSGLVSVGNTLVVANYILAITLGVLTFLNRKHKVIRCSQPMFLYMVLFGCMVSTTTIFFMGIDDNTPDLTDQEAIDYASKYCMLVPAFYSVGFVFSFSALFAKITRIVKIFNNKKLSRVTITAWDMIKPIAVLLAIDVIILVLWGSDEDAKLTWQRIPDLEIKGYPVESTGTCTSANPWPYLGPIVAIHFSVLLFGNIMCYKARNAGTAFSESKYVFIAMVSNLQIMALGLPVLFMVSENPVSNYFIRSGIIFMNDVGVMLLIFAPKLMLVYFGSEEDLQMATMTQASNGTSSGGSGKTSTSDGDRDDDSRRDTEPKPTTP
ncbi:hypothetical protein TrST_g7150 [Triparma strigata]|uniref:G-protein coupled receptors family 3 profile domain-containing protein n=1 Tax=Triparma strigata TaxID=1606541 RepID=A0A9W7BBS8_9STRA|nr:hypothetical protein TrST_g7150 [Triparma strigata]